MTVKAATVLNLPLWIWLALFALLQIGVALFTYSMSLSFDESIWYYIGRNWFRHGMVPYSGGVDNKSPLIFAIFGFSDLLFGVNECFPRILGTVGQTIGLLFCYLLTKLLANERAALLALTIYGLSLLWPSAGGKYVSYTETYSVAAICAAYYSYFKAGTKGNNIISGFLAGLGVGFRISAFFPLIGLFISAILYRPKSAWALTGGFLISLIVLLSAAWISRINPADYLKQGFWDNFGPGSPTDHSWQWKLQNFSNHFLLSGFLVFFLFLITWFLIPVRNYPVFIWFCSAFVAIHVIGIYSPQHFKELLPSLAIISALVIDHLTREWNISTGWVLVVVWIIFSPKTLEPLISLRNYIQGKSAAADIYCASKERSPDEAAKKQLGLWIRSATRPDDQVLVAGYGAEIQAYAERTSPTIYFNTTQTETAIRKLKQDLARAKPAMVLIPDYTEYKRQVIPELRVTFDRFVRQEYDAQGCIFGYLVYKRRPKFGESNSNP